MKYAASVPFQSGLFRASDGADLYWEASGNPAGIPALWLHGGPGGSLGNGGYRRHFDPDRYVLIGIDQRGSGRSRPLIVDALDALPGHTTARLIEDIEEVRAMLEIKRWVLAGISWGTTLALAYALAHPDRVRALALVAVTTTSRGEVDWITEGIGRVFPEAWDDFRAAAHQRPGERIVDAYARQLATGDPQDREAAALAWDAWEGTHISLDSPEARGVAHEDPIRRQVFATLVTHYWSNDGFLPGDRAIVKRIDQIGQIPAALIHGRRDISGPAETAWQLHRRWPASTLTIVEDEAHGGSQEMLRLAKALDAFAAQ